jgi:hypothetical protein
MKNEILFSGKWIELDIMLTDINQTEKDKYHMVSHM